MKRAAEGRGAARPAMVAVAVGALAPMFFDKETIGQLEVITEIVPEPGLTSCG